MVQLSGENGADGTAYAPGRATQEIDYGRRGTVNILGTFRPVSADGFPTPYPDRMGANGVDCPARVDTWLPAAVEPIDAMVGHLNPHRSTSVWRFLLAHLCWELVLQSKYGAFLNVNESWWKILCLVALTGRRFET